MNLMQEAVLDNLPKNLYEEKKQARMCNKLRQFRVEDICKGKSTGVKFNVTCISSWSELENMPK